MDAAAALDPPGPSAPAAFVPKVPATAQEMVGVPIICNGNRGRFLLQRQACVCACRACAQRAQRAGAPHLEMTPTEFERHSGARFACVPTHDLCCMLALSGTTAACIMQLPWAQASVADYEVDTELKV